MTPLPIERRLALSLAPLMGIGLVVVALAWWFAGLAGSQVALSGVVAASAIASAAELSVFALGLQRPIERMLFTMLIRTFAGLAIVTGAVVVAGVDAKLVVLVAAPLYLSLVAGEALATIADTGADSGSTESAATEAK